MKQTQLEIDTAKNIHPGDLVSVKTGYVSSTGIGRVVSVTKTGKTSWQEPCLHVSYNRFIDSKGNFIKNSKTNIQVSVSNATKVTVGEMYDQAIQRASDIRDHLLLKLSK